MGQNINPQNGLLMIVEYQFIDPVHWCPQFDPDSVFPNSASKMPGFSQYVVHFD
jgi:hypothetical protein